MFPQRPPLERCKGPGPYFLSQSSNIYIILTSLTKGQAKNITQHKYIPGSNTLMNRMQQQYKAVLFRLLQRYLIVYFQSHMMLVCGINIFNLILYRIKSCFQNIFAKIEPNTVSTAFRSAVHYPTQTQFKEHTACSTHTMAQDLHYGTGLVSSCE